MRLPVDTIINLRPKFGHFVYPLASKFHSGDGPYLTLRGCTIQSDLLEEFIARFRKLETPDDRDPKLVESIAHRCALNPINRPSFAIGRWEHDYSVRKAFWWREFAEVEDELFSSALNTFGYELKRYAELKGLLSEEVEPESAELLVELFKLGV